MGFANVDVMKAASSIATIKLRIVARYREGMTVEFVLLAKSICRIYATREQHLERMTDSRLRE